MGETSIFTCLTRFRILHTTDLLGAFADQEVEETEAAEPVTDLSNSDVTTKYQEASKIANLALQGVVQQCVAGARVNDLCKFGDTVIEQVHTCQCTACSYVQTVSIFVCKRFSQRVKA